MKLLINALKHFKVVVHHKAVVLKLCIKAGIPWRGLMHDLSKFSPVEFINGARYYNEGKASPIAREKKEKGYSVAWLHHKGRNKHHAEYWFDYNAPTRLPIIPFKYACEMICDQLSAGIVYNGKAWTNSTQKEYWQKHRDEILLNEKIKRFEDTIFAEVAEKGIDEVVNKKNLRKVYDECIK